MHGVSTRSVDDLVKAMGMTGISKSQVAGCARRLTTRCNLPQPSDRGRVALCVGRRDLCEGAESGRIVSAAGIVAIGVNTDGRREVLGMDIGPSEAETFWTEFLRQLARRGLRGVKLVDLRRP